MTAPGRGETTHVFIWNAVSLLAGLTVGIITARALAPGDRGILALIVTLTAVCALISALGTNVSFRAFVAKDPRITVRNYLALTSKLAALQSFVVIIGSIICGFLVAPEFFSFSVIVPCLLLGVVAFYSNQILDALNGLGKLSRSAQLNALGGVVTACLLLSSWWIGTSLLAATLAYAGGFAFRAVVGFALLRQELRAQQTDRIGQQLLVTEGLKFSGYGLGQFLTFRVDQFILGGLLDVRSVGLYAVASTPPAVMQVASNSIGQVLLRDAAHGRGDRKRYVTGVLLAVAITALFSVALVATSDWLIPLVFGAEYADAVELVQILAIGQIVLAPYLVLSRVAIGLGRSRLVSASSLAGLGVAVVAALLFISAYGVVGVAWASVLTCTVLSAYVSVGLIVRPTARKP